MAHQMMLVCEAPGCSVKVQVRNEDVFAPGWVTRQVYDGDLPSDFEEEMFCSDVCELTVLQARVGAAMMTAAHEAAEAASEDCDCEDSYGEGHHDCRPCPHPNCREEEGV